MNNSTTPSYDYKLDLFWADDDRFQSFDGQLETIRRRGTDLYLVEKDVVGAETETPISGGYLLDGNGDGEGDVYMRDFQLNKDANCTDGDNCGTLYLGVGAAQSDDFANAWGWTGSNCHEKPAKTVEFIYDQHSGKMTAEVMLNILPDNASRQIAIR